jgi:hypothetical protein
VLFHAEEFVRDHPDFEGTVERLHVTANRRLSLTPETRRSHFQQRVEAAQAEVVVSRIPHRLRQHLVHFCLSERDRFDRTPHPFG